MDSKTFSDAEVLSIGAGLPLPLAQQLLAQNGGLSGLAKVPTSGLLRQGVTAFRATRVVAALEAGRRSLMPTESRPRLNTPRELAAYLLPLHSQYPVEHFGIVGLNTKHRLITTRMLSHGSLDATVAHPREVFGAAIDMRAAAVVAFHNHPSGDPTPSADDVALTTTLRAAGAVVGIPLLDHVILADGRYYSFMEAGGLNGV